MANSDNVLRAGLTEKHVDVAELMKHVTFEATEPKIIKSSESPEQSFDAPVEEFYLERHKADKPVVLSPETATILFVTEGNGRVSAGENAVTLDKGEAALLLPGNKISVEPSGGSFTFFAVSTPLDKN
jgi:mannose-6-phosphate isomerase